MVEPMTEKELEALEKWWYPQNSQEGMPVRRLLAEVYRLRELHAEARRNAFREAIENMRKHVWIPDEDGKFFELPDGAVPVWWLKREVESSSMPEPMTEKWLEYLESIGVAWCNEERFAALIAEVRRLRELHADALRQIKLIQDQARLEVRRRSDV